MNRQHAIPVLVPMNGPAIPLSPLGLGQDGHGWSEGQVQALIHAHPACLPIAEIDPLFAAPVPICTELNTTAGAIDNLLVTPSGLPVLVECKLWRNPQARREVVGHILDYAKELSRWSSSDLQREARRRLGRGGDPVLELVRAAGHEVEEIAFNDALTLNLRRGRFLLLIVGDGIREGVEAIAEYLQAHAGLHFTLGLVELPIYAMPDGGRLVAPRVVARTTLVRREVIAVPDGYAIQNRDDQKISVRRVLRDNGEAIADSLEQSADTIAMPGRSEVQSFWADFLSGLHLDDPEQAVPAPSGAGHVRFMMPAPNSCVWITTFRVKSENRVGIFLTHSRDPLGRQIVVDLLDDESIWAGMDGDVKVFEHGDKIEAVTPAYFGDLGSPDERSQAIDWLRARLNEWVNALRPRVKAAVAELT